ncbi:hypothetical protein SAY87_027837 [Trapa incisa]|uniref:SHSP domain-containing protein n=1 Tax=Trapa incisa TaxID=236973 RepID=A0AAN7JP58_9MYRT|nr:hypothetical protein SAY87_027837 [Trapa incisa]
MCHCHCTESTFYPSCLMSFRSSGVSSRAGRGSNEPKPLDPKKPILDVPPINSFPYIGPPSSDNNPTFSSVDGNNESGPTLVYIPPHATQEELDNIVSASKNGIVLTGSATMATIGPVVGRVEISENETVYRFRVLLPGVSRNEKDFSCQVGPDGKVAIKGITTTGEKNVIKHSHAFKMLTQNFSPPGHFSVEFKLPGPVEDHLLGGFFVDGILEGLVKKILPANAGN